MKHFERKNRTVACFWRSWGGKIRNLKTYGAEYKFLKTSGKFPHALDFSSDESGIKEADLPEIENWCIKNLTGSCVIIVSSAVVSARFDNKEDAIMFKMSWG